MKKEEEEEEEKQGFALTTGGSVLGPKVTLTEFRRVGIIHNES